MYKFRYMYRIRTEYVFLQTNIRYHIVSAVLKTLEAESSSANQESVKLGPITVTSHPCPRSARVCLRRWELDPSWWLPSGTYWRVCSGHPVRNNNTEDLYKWLDKWLDGETIFHAIRCHWCHVQARISDSGAFPKMACLWSYNKLKT